MATAFWSCATQAMEGSGSAVARSSVVVQANLETKGRVVTYNVRCFEQWDHDVIRLALPYQGNLSVITTTMGVDGVVRVQESNVMAFR